MVVLAVTSAQHLNNAEVWIAFGTGRCFRFIAAHEIPRALGPDRCMALPIPMLFMVAILEEEVNELHGIHGKPTMTLHQHFQCFKFLATTPESVESFIKPLEEFVILLYDRTSNLECVSRAGSSSLHRKADQYK